MPSRRTILTTVAVVTAGLVTGATALAFGGGGGRHGLMKRFVASMIEEVLDEAKATPEQRVKIHAARDRVFAVVEEHRRARPAHLEEALALFEADQVDAGQLDALRARHETDHRRVADAIHQALAEAHDVLDPAQRKVVTDWIRAHHRLHH